MNSSQVTRVCTSYKSDISEITYELGHQVSNCRNTLLVYAQGDSNTTHNLVTIW